MPLIKRSHFFKMTACVLLMGLSTSLNQSAISSEIQSPSFTLGRYGGTENIGTTSLPKTFNLYLASETSSADVLEQMYLGLVKTDPISAKVIPSLAEKWTVSKDKLTYVFQLRKGMKWSDGKPITADDVVFTFNQIINNPHIPNNSRDGLIVDGEFPKVEKLEPLKVKFTIKNPLAPFLRSMGQGIFPQHIFKETTQPNKNQEVSFHTMWGIKTPPKEIVVSGPWKLKSFTQEQEVTLTRNPFYYEKDKAGNQLPYLEHLKWIKYQNLNAVFQALKLKEVDSMALRADDILSLKKQSPPHLKTNNLGPATGTTFVIFNQSKAKDKQGNPVLEPIKTAWFRNQKFRQALAHAVNKPKMIREIYHGLATPQYSHISIQNPFFNPRTPQYPFDLKKAADLLKSGGFTKKENQLFDYKGNPVQFKLVTNSGNTQRYKTCIQLQKDWEKLGIQVNFKSVPFNLMVQKLDQTLDWEAMMIGLTGSAIEPHGGINTWRLDGRMHMFNMGNFKSGWQGTNETLYDTWERDMFIYYNLASEFSEIKKRAFFYDLAQVLAAKQLPFIYTVNQTAFIAVNKRLGNVLPHIRGGNGINRVLWNTEYHYIKK